MNARGKIVLTLLVLGVFGIGVWKWWDRLTQRPGAAPTAATGSAASPGTNAPSAPQASELADLQTELPSLPAPVAYQPQNNTVDVELSEYAGYSGFIGANG